MMEFQSVPHMKDCHRKYTTTGQGLYLPYSWSNSIILVHPWPGTIDSLTIHLEPISKAPQPLLKQWDYSTSLSGPNIDQNVAITAET